MKRERTNTSLHSCALAGERMRVHDKKKLCSRAHERPPLANPLAKVLQMTGPLSMDRVRAVAR